jgi:hypothetical protein
MPGITERIRAIRAETRQKAQTIRESQRAYQTELDKALLKEQQKSRQLVERLEIVSTLSKINEKFLNGKGELTQNTGNYEYEEEHWNYSSNDQGGYEGSTWHPFGATILQLRWEREGSYDDAVRVCTNGDDISVRHEDIPKTVETDLSHKRTAACLRPGVYERERGVYSGTFTTVGMEEEELRDKVDERIAKAFTYPHVGPFRE